MQHNPSLLCRYGVGILASTSKLGRVIAVLLSWEGGFVTYTDNGDKHSCVKWSFGQKPPPLSVGWGGVGLGDLRGLFQPEWFSVSMKLVCESRATRARDSEQTRLPPSVTERI